MELPISREMTLEFLNSMSQLESDMNHYLESEAIMRGLAERFGEDVEYWGMLGLLHDADWSLTKDDLEKHCVACVDILEKLGFDSEFIQTVQSHAYGLDIVPSLKDKVRSEKIEFALVASETLTGLIYAYALMRGGKISDMKVKGLKKKFKSACFAEGCNRDLIKEIVSSTDMTLVSPNTGISLNEFFEIGINAVNDIKTDINLE